MVLDPFLAGMLASTSGRPALSAGSPAEGRALVASGREALGKGPEMAIARDVTISSRSGAVAARYLSPTTFPDGLLLYLHGGGWVIGALDDYDAYARALAAESGYGVLLLDYRLAPEHPFPAGLMDCEDALAACLAGSIEGVSVTRPFVVAGDSAGANLATVSVRHLPHRDWVAAQILYYPVTDCDFSRESYSSNGEGLNLTARDMKWFFAHYAAAERWVSPDISPLRADDLRGMPPTIVVTAEYDVLRDEGEAYAHRLQEAGVLVTARRLNGVTHGFVRLHNLFTRARGELAIVASEIRAAGEAYISRH
jgi:acetyl esterase